MNQNIFFLIILATLGIGFYLIWSAIKRRQDETKPDQSFLLLQNTINELRKTLDQKLGEVGQTTQHQFTQSMKIVGEVTEKLTKLDETNKQVINFADQLKNLQDILKNPKQRGIIGEYYLETVLKNVLPPGSYQMQYPFKDGTIVDAVIFYQDRIIPVDSKFSLENYNKILETKNEMERKKYEDALRGDLKNRIDETSKYIKPSEGTIEFAFMFIPSEALYYDLLINKVGSMADKDLIKYATGDKKVFIVSPTSFLAYLQTVIWGLNQMKISKSAEQIQKNVSDLARHLQSYETHFKKLGANLNTTYNAYTKAYGELKKVDKDVYRITGEEMNIEPTLLQPPATENDE